jgi:hypothetical protein
MKTKDCLYKGFMVLAVVLLAALAGACIQPLGELEMPPAATGRLSVRITGSGNAANQNSRTMLASDPTFTRYELYVTRKDTGVKKTFQSPTGLFEIDLENGTYTLAIAAAGFSGDKITARTEPEDFSITSGGSLSEEFTLKPYKEKDIYGTLQYSLNWDDVGQIPAQAELLIEQFNDHDKLISDDDTWDPLPISLMNESITAGSRHGSILLVQRTTGLVKQSGSLDLPPGEYRLTTTVTMDSPYPPVSRMDIAHIFSNLVTPAAFFYSSGDLIVTNPGTDTGSGFITRFNFSQTPGAASIIASNPSPDGTRLIMVTVPPGIDTTKLTPLVECAPGASVISPPPKLLDGQPYWDQGDYSTPTTWVAKGLNGVTQEYTVMVTNAANTDCVITDLAFREVREVSAPQIDQSATGAMGDPREITVTVPYGTTVTLSEATTVTLPTGPVNLTAGTVVTLLTPVFSYIGTKVMFVTEPGDENQDKPLSGKVNFGNLISSPAEQYFRVYAEDNTWKLYKVIVTQAADNAAEITQFVFDGYPDKLGQINNPSAGDITVTLPYGTNLSNLKPLISYKGKTLSPASGVEQNFSTSEFNPVSYTVTAEDGTTKTYNVKVKTEIANTDAGIFDFVITNVPRAKVVIGTKPRADGKIPIVVQVPYRTEPLKSDGSMIDLTQLEYRIILPADANSSWAWEGGPSPKIPFGNEEDNYQEAVFRVTAENTSFTQDYVVVVARDVHYYYVKATGDDTDPDDYNGGSESTPFKTLAHAVYQAVRHSVNHIYVIGTLNDSTEGGAWEDTSALAPGVMGGTFHSSDASATGGGASVFNLRGTGKEGDDPYRIYITGVGSNAILQGTSTPTAKRVISVTGGAHITFENITIRDGGSATYTGNGGGVYVGDNSTVIWKSGVITANRAASGGGVYVDTGSEFDFRTGSISSNTAAGKAIGVTADDVISTIQGGGGVYLNGENSLFWLAAGDISNNTASGSGGGVLVNGSFIPENCDYDNLPNNFIMSAGTITGNVSNGSVWPGGGGGLYVAKGTFQMFSGRISENQSTRQGGGVFVWSRSLFFMDGNSSVVNNKGVGSSAAICSRGITWMRGSAQADKVYIWNYSKGLWNNGSGDEFTMSEGARITGLELAFADGPQDNRNYINIVQSDRFPPLYFTGTDRITTIGLESRLTSSGSFDPNATIAGDWLGKYLIKNNGQEIPSAQTGILTRLFLDSYIYGGANPIRLTNYKLDTRGRLAVK